jgi:CheY-like chemotaxis protein
MDYPFDTTLRPGTYKLTARLELAGAKPFVSEEKFEVVLVPRPLPYRMPVVMWGVYGPESVLRELPRLKEIGFTHSLGLRANCESIWSAGKPIAPDKPENIAAAQRMLNAALASDFGIIASLSPGHELRDHKDLWRVNRDGQPRDAKKPDICALTPGVSNFCYNVGASVAQTYGAFPAFQSALLHTEVRDGANLCFHEHDRAGYRAATGLDIPAEVASKSGVRFDKLKDFPANRVIADDHPLYRYLQWYWKAGDGYNQLNTALHLGLKSTGRADLLEIQKSAHRAASLTDQLLAFSRKQAVALAPLHINKVVNDTQKMVQRLIGEDIRIETNLAPNLPQVRADAGQFQQVLMNLAIHAREAMPHGGRLSIRTDTVVFDEQDMSVMADARPGCFIYLAVTDTGAGMSREELAHVFEPFYNLPDSGKGTGLGLSVVYGIAQQHQGWIHVYSQQGKGTTFKLYLPACPTELGGTDLLPVAPATPPAGRGERILLVEDELAIRQWATRVLRGAGYEVLTADSAAGALTLFRQEEGRFALLFSDIVLPDQSGLEIAEQVRQQQPGLPVLLCSGYTDEHDRWSAIEQQRFHFLQKPYPCAQLLRRIRAILDTASA